MKNFIIFMGNYGSGKTELAINFALRAAQKGSTLLIDLDMINTYFRLYDRREMFSERGIRLIAPHLAGTNVEMLTVPAEIAAAFDGAWDTVLIDLGGDSGASALGQYHDKLAAAEQSGARIEVLNVVNANRPMSGTPEKLLRLMEKMERKARWRVTGFVNNTNLSYETTAADLALGYEIVREAAITSGVPVRYTSGKPEVLDGFLAQNPQRAYVGEPFPLQTYMHRDWDRLTKEGV